MANTIDVLGDDLLSDMIISRNITELIDDVLTSIGLYAFHGCSSLTSVEFPIVTSINTYAFYGCSSLTSVEFPATTSIGDHAFYGCSSLTTADFPAVTTIGGSAFYGCSSLTTIDFPAVTTISGNAFINCSRLTSVILRNTSQVATLSSTNAFSGAPNAIIYVPDALVNDYKAATNWSTYADRIKGLSELPEGGE